MVSQSMEREDKNGYVDEVFRERLSDLNVTPPADIWKTVRSAIPGRKKVRYITVFRLAAATLLLFILTGSLWLIYLNRPSDRDLADQPVSTVKDKTLPPAVAEEGPVAPPQRAGSATAQKEVAVVPSRQVAEGGVATQTQNVTERGIVAARGPAHTLLQRAIVVDRIPGVAVSSDALILPAAEQRTGNIGYSAAILNTPQQSLDLGTVPPALNIRKEQAYVWGIGADLGPVFSYRNLPYRTEYTRFLNSQEAGTMSYGGNISVFVRRKKRLSVQSGIGYYRTGQVSKDMVAFRQIKTGQLAILESKGNNYLYNSGGNPGYDHVPLFIANRTNAAGNDQTEYILTSLGHGLYEPVDAQLKMEYEFVEVPLLLRYRIIDRAFGVNVTGGMGASMLFHSSASVLTADGENTTLGQIDGLRRTNFNGTLGVGVSYRITRDFLFRLEPTFKYYINPVSETDGIDFHPFLFGIYSGLSLFF